MLLSPQEASLFFKLHSTLLCYVNRRVGVVPDGFAQPQDYFAVPPKDKLKLRCALVDEIDLIETFVDQPPGDFSEEELDIVLSWRHSVAGEFFVFRYLKNYTVFLSSAKQPRAYGVVALSQPIDELLGPYLPVHTKTVLLPFKDRIVYDGLLESYNLSFGPGIRRSLNDDYRQAKRNYGIITSLPLDPASVPAAAPTAARPSGRRKKLASGGEAAQEVLRVIVGLTDDFCRQHLDDEYRELCRLLAQKLARKRPSPLLKGEPAAWASGIVRTIGWANFLDDPSQTPHMKSADIDKSFGVGQSTGQARAKQIRDMLHIGRFEPGWTLPSRLDDNPLVWMVSVDGIPMDIRDCPRELREAAFAKGLIPYIPADRQVAAKRDD